VPLFFARAPRAGGGQAGADLGIPISLGRVAIRASASQEVRRLIGDLEGADPVKRDAALARLAVIGTRAVRQLLEHLSTASADATVTLLGALESIPDPRAVEPVLGALDHADPRVRLAAIKAARQLLALTDGTRVLDKLTAFAVDPARPGPERAAAIGVLGSLSTRTLGPLVDRLRADPSADVRAAIEHIGLQTEDPVAELEDSADGWLGRDPGAVLHLVTRAGDQAPLSTLHRLIEKARSREADGRRGLRRDWATVRAALHLALARRGSTVALYDLREAFEAAHDPLPADYLAAVTVIGDATCLEPLALAYAAAHDLSDTEHWRRDLAAAFKAIMEREGLTRRHAALRRVRGRFRKELEQLLA
jgi:HEAT repeat protein